jgi:hypothetical protein
MNSAPSDVACTRSSTTPPTWSLAGRDWPSRQWSAIASTASAAEAVAVPFVLVGIRKLVVLMVITFGVYLVYWLR